MQTELIDTTPMMTKYRFKNRRKKFQPQDWQAKREIRRIRGCDQELAADFDRLTNEVNQGNRRLKMEDADLWLARWMIRTRETRIQ